MAFTPEPTVAPVSIGGIVVTLVDRLEEGPEIPASQSATFEIVVVMSDGTIRKRYGDLVPHITPEQRQALVDFMTGLRVQAEDQILP